ncbi:MAG: sulfurtransferase [Gammaproteobacteria bacterium]|nr:sulfurtransferase [Gammaproteobacteria bacterium]
MSNTPKRLLTGLLSLILAACATAQGDSDNVMATLASKQIVDQPYGWEDQDWNKSAPTQYKIEPYHLPTPTIHPGAQLIRTYALRELILSSEHPVVINVLGTAGSPVQTEGIPASVWLPGAGLADLDEEKDRRFGEALKKLTGGDPNKPLVFYCLDARCWLSYNAALRAQHWGYSNIYWYRGGIYAWWKADLPIITQSVAYNFL